jgi:DNA primase
MLMQRNRFSSAANEQALIAAVVEYYADTLECSLEAQKFLTDNGFELKLCNQKIGYSDRTLCLQLPSRRQIIGKELRAALVELGILDSNGREVFHGSVVFPIVIDTKIKGLYGHRIAAPSKLRETASVVTLLMFEPELKTVLLNQHQFTDSDAVLVFDNYFDALYFEQYGWVTTVFDGSSDCISLFKQQSYQRVIFMLSIDSELTNAALSLLQALSTTEVSTWQCRLPLHWKALLDKQSKAELIEQWIQRSISLHGEGSLSIAQPEVTEAITLNHETLALINQGEEYWLSIDNRQYRIRNFSGESNQGQLKVNLLLQTETGFFVDIIDVYQAKQRQHFSKLACIDCRVDAEVIKKDLGQLILSLEHHQSTVVGKSSIEPVMSDKGKREALDWLHNNNLLQALQSDLGACGIVGETENRLLAYLACTSRLLTKPIAVLIQSASSAGKSSLMDAVLKLMPKESQYVVSTLTGQSLYYMGQGQLQHKILAIAEEEGVAQASYALKLLQSQGEVSIATANRSKDSGQMSTTSYLVKGPVMLFLTTTAIDIDEELVNRCLVLTVNETREQTRQIHQYQRFRKTLQGWESEQQLKQLIEKHRNIQRLLKQYRVVNPFAESLSFMDTQTRTRRDHEKYLTLIDSIALLHQYQRPVKQFRQGKEVVEYIEVTLEDIQIANALAQHVFTQTLDELPPQTRRCLNLITDFVQQQSTVDSSENNTESSAVTFTRRDIREFTQWSHTQVHIHCKRLEELEYLSLTSNGKSNGKTNGNNKGKSYQLNDTQNKALIDTNKDVILRTFCTQKTANNTPNSHMDDDNT